MTGAGFVRSLIAAQGEGARLNLTIERKVSMCDGIVRAGARCRYRAVCHYRNTATGVTFDRCEKHAQTFEKGNAFLFLCGVLEMVRHD
jgi:hypothetical protein